MNPQPPAPRWAPTPGPVKRRVPGRRERALALAEDLAEDLAAVELDEVDGEFFWRCCRGDLLEAVEALFDGRPRPIGVKARPKGGLPADDGDALPKEAGPDGVFGFLREGLRFAGDLLVLADEAGRLYPAGVWRRLVDGERVAMRAANGAVESGHANGGAGGGPAARLRVFSGAWGGQQVEDELRRLVASWPRWIMEDPEPGEGDVALRVGFALVDEARARADPFGEEPTSYPYVEVAAAFPLPPQGAVAREYDAIVRGLRRWHERLPGAGSRQEKAVAIRTWAVGLLVAAGEPFGGAMQAVAGRIGDVPVSQTRFGQDRQKLVERVPEAGPYVFTRGQGGEADARADDPFGLGNPAEPLPPLQAPEAERGAYT